MSIQTTIPPRSRTKVMMIADRARCLIWLYMYANAC